MWRLQMAVLQVVHAEPRRLSAFGGVRELVMANCPRVQFGAAMGNPSCLLRFVAARLGGTVVSDRKVDTEAERSVWIKRAELQETQTPPAMVASSARVSEQMSRLPRKDTTPELALRRVLFASGLRYRVHQRVPGMPRRTVDMSFTRVRVAVFVDGCFWHGCPYHGMTPKANRDWWSRKLDGNRSRDAETSAHLSALGWVVLRFWSHEEPDAMAESVKACVLSRRLALGLKPLRRTGAST